jgi:hypothetical protein
MEVPLPLAIPKAVVVCLSLGTRAGECMAALHSNSHKGSMDSSKEATGASLSMATKEEEDMVPLLLVAMPLEDQVEDIPMLLMVAPLHLLLLLLLAIARHRSLPRTKPKDPNQNQLIPSTS